MEIYVSKIKRRSIDILLRRSTKYKYRLVFHENGYSHIDCFTSRDELYQRLLKKELYKKQYFPRDKLSIGQFIDKEFSIYYY